MNAPPAIPRTGGQVLVEGLKRPLGPKIWTWAVFLPVPIGMVRISRRWVVERSRRVKLLRV